MIDLKDLDDKYLKEAITLAVNEYEQEARKCKALIQADVRDKISDTIETLFRNRLGKIAIFNNRVVGYLAFAGPIEGAFGNVRGVFSPIGGSAFSGPDRGKLASLLFAESAEEIVRNGIFGFALSRYAHDDEVGRSFILNGFGIRCADGILRLSDRKIVDRINTEITFRELTGKDKGLAAPLKKNLIKHLRKAPAFFLVCRDDNSGWLYEDQARIFVAEKAGKILGYMALDEEGETFVSEHSSIYNVCGAYVEEDYRQSGVAQQLLEYLCQVCESEGKAYLGVDCETLNPTALRFWNKYFQNYTYSYARRVDERLADYKNT